MNQEDFGFILRDLSQNTDKLNSFDEAFFKHCASAATVAQLTQEQKDRLNKLHQETM